MAVLKHSVVSFGLPDIPPLDAGSSIGPISLHNAIVVYVTIHVPTLHAGSIKNGLKSPTVSQKRSLKSTSSSESSSPILCRHPSTMQRPWRAYSDTTSGGKGFEK